MISSALPYDPRWVAKLLRRGIHKLKAKAVTKIKARFAPSSKSSISSPEQVDIVMVEPKESRSIESSPSTACTTEASSTLYEFLEGHLKTMWASRDRNVSHKDRWQFRGSWLVLWMALQACPSNSSYYIFDGPRADEKMLLLEMLETSAMKTPDNGPQVSRMSATLYEGARPRVRYDSFFCNGTSGAHAIMKPTPAQLWRKILEAAIDASKMSPVAEELLSSVWPGEDVAEILGTIGNPAKHFRKDDELRLAFQGLLFLTYNAVSSAPLH